MRKAANLPIVGLLLVFVVTMAADWAQSQPGGGIPVEHFWPSQLNRGEETTISVGGKKLKDIQSVEITPSDGISVRGIKIVEKNKWAVTVFVEAEAEPGERTLVLVTPKGRSEAQTVRVPTHVPRIFDLRILSTRGTGAEVEFTFSIFDEAGDLGPHPSVWRELWCGRDGNIGIEGAQEVAPQEGQTSQVHHRSSVGLWTVTGVCELRIRLSDENNYQSNTLVTAVSF